MYGCYHGSECTIIDGCCQSSFPLLSSRDEGNLCVLALTILKVLRAVFFYWILEFLCNISLSYKFSLFHFDQIFPSGGAS
jgi:hypothetical protein